MSDIAENALRYTPTNTRRSDFPNPHNGEKVAKQKTGEAIIAFDCSGFVCHVIIESGFRINYETTKGLRHSNAFYAVAKINEVKPGDIILFDGHVGIVTEYDQSSSLGRFIHMSGTNSKGSIKISYFVGDKSRYEKTAAENLSVTDDERITYGITRKIVMFMRVKPQRYSAVIDMHLNHANPTPILNPQGTRVYSEYTLKGSRESKSISKGNALSKKPAPRAAQAPEHRNLKNKNVPLHNEVLLQRIHGIWI